MGNRIDLPLVTVYITNYNYGDYCEKAIESVLNQSYQNYELIVIDDGSIDSSREKLEQYRGRENIELVFQQNIGLNKTNNRALERAKGKYIVRLDADDWFAPSMIEILVLELERDQSLGLVFPDYYEVDENGNTLRQISRHDFSSGVSMLDQPAHGACTMFRRKSLMEVGGYDEQFTCQDGVDIWLKMIETHKVKNIKKPLFYYRQHSRSLTKDNLKILKTRKEIYKQRVLGRGLPRKSVVAVIPVRGDDHKDSNLALEQVGGKALIDWTIESALASETISSVVVSTPSEKIRGHVERYGSDVVLLRRDDKMAGSHTSLTATLLNVVGQLDLQSGALMVLSIQAPFRESFYNDTAVYTMQLFDADVVDGVIVDDNIFYYHGGHGLKLWQEDRDIRLERDIIYRRAGGLNLIDVDFLKKNNATVGGKMGHVVLDQKSAMTIRTAFDLELAQAVCTDESCK